MRLPRHTPLVCSFLLGAGTALAQTSEVGSAARSDSIDLLHTRIQLDLTGAASGTVRGDATITFTPRVPQLSTLPLDLLLPVDSVVMGGLHLPFQQPGEVVAIDLQAAYGPGDTLTLTVSYGGTPTTDPSGFGGFYTQGPYQYDLGVAFDAIPHSYGRAWFPCFDNFVERSSMEYLVHTVADRTVYANGQLLGVTELGGGERISHWQMEEPIPSYLASIAAGHYTALHDTFPSVSGADIPVVLAALPADTANMRASFIHLKNAFDTFERWFGPYRWNRVGFVLTTAGAMEHATNICYPDFVVDGSLSNEDLMAHELSHHWFGNLVTCATPEEMYFNEGFANFCAQLFIEDLYGEEAYRSLVRTNHRQVVSGTHLRDGGWYALADVPQSKTYGETSYKKGANIARTLRATLGDSLFSTAMQRLFAHNEFSAMGSIAIRDSLSVATGQDLTAFFDAWVLQPGGAAFMVDSFRVITNGPLFSTEVHIRQKTRGGAGLFQQVPVTISCLGPAGELYRTLADLGGAYSIVELEVPFHPTAVRLNDDERLALSTTVDTATVTTIGQLNFPHADMRLITSALPAPAHVRIEEFWVPADEAADGDALFVSPDRWWRVETDLQPGTEMVMRVTVDGRANFPASYDQGLMQDVNGTTFHEDSLVVLYRPGAHAPWSEMPATVSHSGSATDKYARLDMPGFRAGDYTVAWRTLPTAVQEVPGGGHGWRAYPDPASQHITVSAPLTSTMGGARLLIRDLSGRTLAHHELSSTTSTCDVSRIAPQTVLLSISLADGSMLELGHLRIIR